MNVLFITLLDIKSIDQHDIYTDLMREFVSHGHEMYVVSPSERRNNIQTGLIEDAVDEAHSRAHILKVKTGNIQKTNVIEKGVSTVLLEYQLLVAIKKYYRNIRFDLILYSTPPITLIKPIEFIKKRDGARTYLLLKDIFPQNAVDMGMLSKDGIKGALYKNFRNKERKLYEISDKIGCMSQANVDYVIIHNPEVDKNKVKVCPNSIEIQDVSITEEEKIEIRNKYGIPLDKKVFVYGGNLGKPQGIPFIIECLKATKQEDAFFLIVGDGTEYDKLEQFVSSEKPSNVRLLKRLPVEDYNRMISACDVGLIFLDYRFTIPNVPSRLLAYMQAKLPVLACTDANTDIGKVIEDGNFGWWCPSNDTSRFLETINSVLNGDITAIGLNGFNYLVNNYSAKECYNIIMEE